VREKIPEYYWPPDGVILPEMTSPVRYPEAFATEMSELRKRYNDEHLTPKQRHKLVLDSYDGFLAELRRRVCQQLACKYNYVCIPPVVG